MGKGRQKNHKTASVGSARKKPKTFRKIVVDDVEYFWGPMCRWGWVSDNPYVIHATSGAKYTSDIDSVDEDTGRWTDQPYHELGVMPRQVAEWIKNQSWHIEHIKELEHV